MERCCFAQLLKVVHSVSDRCSFGLHFHVAQARNICAYRNIMYVVKDRDWIRFRDCVT